MKINVIITGATGMVGEGVLHECLLHPDVEKVLVIGRRSCDVKHSKLQEVLHSDFNDFDVLKDTFKDFNACFFCLGVSSVGMKEEKYSSITFDLTMSLANTLHEVRPDATFCYISGVSTDSTEKGKTMWARVKGRTENAVMGLFDSGYAIRPGYIQPTNGLKNTYTIYKFVKPLYPVLKFLFPGAVCTMKELGLSMIHVAKEHTEPHILECRDIRRIAQLEKQSGE